MFGVMYSPHAGIQQPYTVRDTRTLCLHWASVCDKTLMMRKSKDANITMDSCVPHQVLDIKSMDGLFPATHTLLFISREREWGKWILRLTLWLCSDSCHSRCVPGQKWPDSKQLLINLSLCYIFTKYWIQSFCQLVFFHLGLVLCFYLHLINRRPHLSESRHLIYWVKKAFFMNNFHNIKQKIIKICTVSHTSVL